MCPFPFPPRCILQTISADILLESCFRFSILQSSRSSFSLVNISFHFSGVRHVSVSIVLGSLPGTGRPICFIRSTTSGGSCRPVILVTVVACQRPILTGGAGAWAQHETAIANALKRIVFFIRFHPLCRNVGTSSKSKYGSEGPFLGREKAGHHWKSLTRLLFLLEGSLRLSRQNQRRRSRSLKQARIDKARLL